MVRLSKIYTRTGDDGACMLGDGARVPKTSPRVCAYGAVDEANAAIGAAAVECASNSVGEPLRRALSLVQNDLFDVGADLCTPIAPDEQAGARLRVVPEQAARLERLIDEHNAALKPLDSFVLPGGTRLAATLHVARTAVRRAEREVAALLAAEPGATNAQTLVYLNRLSDLLFVLARVANAAGGGDVLWKPGAGREGDAGA